MGILTEIFAAAKKPRKDPNCDQKCINKKWEESEKNNFDFR